MEVWIPASQGGKVRTHFLREEISGFCLRYMPILDPTKRDGKKSKDLDGPPQPEGNMYWDPAEM